MMLDPLAEMQVDFESYDIKREASVYFDAPGELCWTKAWFNNNPQGEDDVQIQKEQAIKFINGEISLNDWLSRFFAKQMNAYNKAIQQTRQTFINNNY